MLRNIHNTAGDGLTRIMRAIERLGQRVDKQQDILQREALRAKGYQLEYRTNPTPGLYLVNKRNNDPNFNVATFLGP